jgi:ADP-ribose pyrophosphatase YjhB (NUDIX family)
MKILKHINLILCDIILKLNLKTLNLKTTLKITTLKIILKLNLKLTVHYIVMYIKAHMGFVKKKRNTKKQINETDVYKNFNVGNTKLRRSQTRCGIIAFNPECDKIICVQNKTMLDKFGQEQWGLPKGHMEQKDHNYSSCASREFKEETGIVYRLEQKKHLFKRVNNTMYYPVIIHNSVHIQPYDTKEIMAAEWKDISELKSLGIETNKQNQDLKVLLHRYINEMIVMAKKNNNITTMLKKK